MKIILFSRPFLQVTLRQALILVILVSQLFQVYSQSIEYSYDQSGNQIRTAYESLNDTIEVSGPDVICAGEATVISVGNSSSFIWSNGLTESSISVAPAETTIYSVTVTTSNGCTFSASKTIEVQVPEDLVSINQTTPDGQTPVGYTVSNPAAESYSWSIIGGSIVAGQGSSTIQVVWDNDQVGELSVFGSTELGCLTDTVVLQVVGGDEQLVPLNEGWNLVSTYISPSDYSIPVVFSELNQEGVLERVKTIEDLYNPAIPIGNSLEFLEDGAGYWVNVNTPATWYIAGQKLDPLTTPIELNEGWNLVGYLPNRGLGVPEALASIWPNVSFVKNIFSSYDPAAPPVLNTLEEMVPGQAYWVKMNASATLTYPADALQPPPINGLIAEDLVEWQEQTIAYPSSLAAYGVVTMNGAPIGQDEIILATVGNEIRGVAKTVTHNDQSYVTFVINGLPPEEISFLLVRGDQVLTSNFVYDMSQGVNRTDFLLPITFGEVTANTEQRAQIQDVEIYPNPTPGIFMVEMNLLEGSEVQIEILSLSGQLVLSQPKELLHAGRHLLKVDLNARGVPAGTYLVKIHTENNTTNHLLVIQN